MGQFIRARAIALIGISVFLFASLSYGKYSSNPNNLNNAIKCLDEKGAVLPVNNDEVLTWKAKTPNQWLSRGHVTGILTKVYPDRNGHKHFQIQIGHLESETLEVVYNDSFGHMPELKEGMSVEACGDYITSNAPTTKYPEHSPDDAIIHWVHKSTSKNHYNGYVILDTKLYGFNIGR